MYRWRKLLAAMLSAAATTWAAAAWPDSWRTIFLCRQYLQRFLCEHQVAFPVPLYDSQGRYLLAAPDKIDLLVRTLLSSVTRGRDNELFVLLVDVLEAGPKLQNLLRAVQVARARHHRVLVICPWPAELALPGTDEAAEGQLDKERGKRKRERGPTSLQELFFQANAERLRLAGRWVKQSFARIGVPVLFSPEQQSVAMILHHMQQLQLLERGGP